MSLGSLSTGGGSGLGALSTQGGSDLAHTTKSPSSGLGSAGSGTSAGGQRAGGAQSAATPTFPGMAPDSASTSSTASAGTGSATADSPATTTASAPATGAAATPAGSPSAGGNQAESTSQFLGSLGSSIPVGGQYAQWGLQLASQIEHLISQAQQPQNHGTAATPATT